MSLQLFELVPTTPSREAAEALIAQVSQAVEAAGASVLESQVTASHERIFTIVELDSDDVTGLTEAVRSAAADAESPAPTRSASWAPRSRTCAPWPARPTTSWSGTFPRRSPWETYLAARSQLPIRPGPGGELPAHPSA